MEAMQPAPALQHAATYRRHVHASLARVWENVFDWEHLPWLHASSFTACDLVESGDWGWRVKLTSQPGDPRRAQLLELRADRPGLRYVVTTLEGQGRSSEIRVQLKERAPHETDVEVQFHVPEADPARLAAIGARYVEIYTLLWDEDEAMMQARERALKAPRAREAFSRFSLGSEQALRARLPAVVNAGGASWRIIELDGKMIVHAAVCPHWLGPLGDAPVVEGQVTCPWHGYRFDVRTGECTHGGKARLAQAPKVECADGEVWLSPA